MSARPFPESVLVVDDAEFMIRVLEEMFASEGYAVRAARSGPEALALYEEVLPDLVTLDVVMPGMDGLEVLRRLREIDPSAKVIVVSAVGLEARVMEAVRLGARNYILKPFEREKVLAAARRVLDEY